MERILAGMTPDNSSIWAGIHAMNLAKRINAHVSFLLVDNTGSSDPPPAAAEKKDAIERIETLIEEGRSEQVPLEYYRAEGDYAGILVDFVHEHRITLLVVAAPAEKDARGGDFKTFIEELHHRLNCRIEVVQIKPLT